MAATPKLAIFTVVGTLAYIGLAVLGWGGVSAFFSNPARTVLALATIVMAAVALLSSGNLNPGEREDRGNRWVLAVFGGLGLLSAWLPAYTDRIDFWTFDGDTVRWIGVVLFMAGGALRLWPVFVLGHRFSGLVAIQPGHRLVTDGVYRIIRHPSYLGLLISALGWALAFRSGVGVILTALLLIPLTARMNAEERLLRSQFGREYDDYCARTSRLVPGLYQVGATHSYASCRRPLDFGTNVIPPRNKAARFSLSSRLTGRTFMADDKSKQDMRDRSRVAGDEDYEIRYFAQEVGIGIEQARDLIARHGNDRETLIREAKKLS